MNVVVNLEFPNTLVEKVVRAIMDNYPEASATLHCRRWDYDRCQYQFLDCETEKVYDLNLTALGNAFPLLYTAKWPKGCTQSVPTSTDWQDWDEWLCNCDATDFDAFVQLAALGEVIYG